MDVVGRLQTVPPLQERQAVHMVRKPACVVLGQRGAACVTAKTRGAGGSDKRGCCKKRKAHAHVNITNRYSLLAIRQRSAQA